jgi:hypothetical protein
MRARRVGTGSEFRLFQDEQEIGHVDGTSVSFRGFDTPDDAALAASVAQRALARRRGEHRHSADGADDVIAVEDESMQVIGARHGVWQRCSRQLPKTRQPAPGVLRSRSFPVSVSRSSPSREPASYGGHSRVPELGVACDSSTTA